MNAMSIKPHGYFLIAAVIIPALYWLAKPLRIHIFPFNLAGTALIVAGLWLLMKALRIFQKHGTPERIDQLPVAIVTNGPYHITRNPQYLAGFIILMGVAALAPTLPGFAIPFLYIFIINMVFIPPEEKKMMDTFGAPYEEYKKTVRRWI